jgi:ABC-type glycerol-3-phosphate transport system substrate-binding protein
MNAKAARSAQRCNVTCHRPPFVQLFYHSLPCMSTFYPVHIAIVGGRRPEWGAAMASHERPARDGSASLAFGFSSVRAFCAIIVPRLTPSPCSWRRFTVRGHRAGLVEGDVYPGVGQTSRRGTARGVVLAPLAFTLLLLLWQGGCTYLVPESVVPPAPPTVTRPPQPTRAATPEPVATQVNPNAAITLTLWLPPEMARNEVHSAAGEGSSGYPVMGDWNAAFLAANPRVRLEILSKAAYGPGGIVSMVLATRPVVPARLPDVIAFDTAELPRLAQAGVLQPLDDLLPATLWQGMYPFAVDAVTVDGQRLAVPYQADIDVLVYDREAVPEPARAWEWLLSAVQEGDEPRPTYIFPAAGSDGSAADAFMVHYLALGGRLTEENGRPYLDSGIVARVLRSYRGAMDAGTVPEAVRGMRTREDCWAAYLEGEAQLASATTNLYQRDMAQLEGSGYAPLPTVGGSPMTLARSRAWGVITDDPVRRELAAQYIATALEAERVGAWCAATGYLPTQRGVLPTIVQDAPYRRFVDEQLESAQPYPSLPDYAAMQAAVVRAIEDVLDGLATPERAAVAAAATVVRLR